MRNSLLLFLPLSWTVQLVNATPAPSPSPLATEVFANASTILISAQELAQNARPGECLIDPKVQAPFKEGSTSLSTAPSDSNVTYLALGVGYQNYTCSDKSADDPKLIGSTANLFDVSCLAGNRDLLAGLPRAIEDMALTPEAVALAAVVWNKFTATDKKGTDGFQLGNLYVSGDPDHVGDPVFDLSLMNNGIVQVSAVNSTAPPTNAPPNSADWVRYGNVKVLGGPTKITDVYRVWTAGGNSQTSVRRNQKHARSHTRLSTFSTPTFEQEASNLMIPAYI